jgi:hypothetical protein
MSKLQPVPLAPANGIPGFPSGGKPATLGSVKKFFLLAGLHFIGCVQTPVIHTSKPGAYGPLQPGGPVYGPVEFLVSDPPPVDPPFGRYFANDQPPVPPAVGNPYWISGYWGWKKDAWEWVPGRWVERPRPGVIWMNARYYRTGGQQYWVAGYWE